MAEEQVCGGCTHFYSIRVPTGRGGARETEQGHCLAQSVYAKNKPGNPVFPPGAKTEELPYAQHKIVIVRRKQKSPQCITYQKKEGKK